LQKCTLVLWTVLILGCSSQPAPIVSREQPPSAFIKTHMVEKGDTLYSIAWRYDFSVDLLATVNGLRHPYILKQGQILSLDKTANSSVKGLQKAQNTASKALSKNSDTAISKNQTTPKVAPTAKISAKNLRWQSPVKGQVVEDYNPKELRKGVVIEAVSGSSVRPAAKGVVVYAGDGLRDYGKLVIIKHTEYLLSAYGHNQKILVSEGQTVNNGKIISELGASGRLYFEIRKDGNPVNPLSYLD